MPPWEPLPVETDPDAVTDRILDGIAVKVPGWVPVEGAPEVVLAEEIGRETALTNTRAIDVVEVAFAGIGETVYGLPSLLGAKATMMVRLTVTGVGALVPDGFTVVGTTPNGIEVAFELLGDVASDATTVDVTMRAREVGAVYNAVPIGSLIVVTSTATVTDASALTASAGGVDPELITDYLSRLVDYIATLRPGGVRGTDLAILARNVVGVHRALGVDLYDATTGQSNVERTVTVFPVDVDGLPVLQATKDALQAALEAVREVNFVIRVADPTYTAVQVNFTAVAETGADPVQVQLNVHAAIVEFLNPARWGASIDDPAAWVDIAVVRYLDLARVAGSAEGVAYLSALTLDGGTVDVTLPGPAALPASTTTGTVLSSVTGTVA